MEATANHHQPLNADFLSESPYKELFRAARGTLMYLGWKQIDILENNQHELNDEDLQKHRERLLLFIELHKDMDDIVDYDLGPPFTTIAATKLLEVSTPTK